MSTRDTLDHQRRMLRHLTTQADTLKSATAQLKQAVDAAPSIPRVMSGAICPRCGIRYLRLDGTCECHASR
jgi:hypothetical protein